MVLPEYGYGELEDATEGFSLKNLMGKGSHGCVYKARLQRGETVAVKRVSAGLRSLDDRTKLENELRILANLPTSRRHHFVNVLGVSRKNSVSGEHTAELIVMEIMPNGTLHDVLFNDFPTSSQGPAFTWYRTAMVALQIAEAIDCLHQMRPPVIHRDIKSTNILFDEYWRARIGDFGLAIRQEYHISPPAPAGTIGYMDPLYTCPWKLSTKNDVFSFGVVLLEMINRRRAIDVEREPAFLVEWVRKSIGRRDGSVEELLTRYDPENFGRLPADIEWFARPMMEIALSCVSVEEHARPPMKEVVREMKRVVNNARLFPRFVGRFLQWKRKSHRFRSSRTVPRLTRIVCKVHEEERRNGDVTVDDVGTNPESATGRMDDQLLS